MNYDMPERIWIGYDALGNYGTYSEAYDDVLWPIEYIRVDLAHPPESVLETIEKGLGYAPDTIPIAHVYEWIYSLGEETNE